MADTSNIEWTDATFNPWIGCTKISPACDHCYAERDFDHRRHQVKWGAGQPRKRTSKANWKLPLRWNKQPYCQCPACGWRGEKHKAIAVFGLLNIAEDWCPACRKAVVQPARRRVLCASLADVFDNEVPSEWRHDLFELIRITPHLDWLLLTKQPQNIVRMVREHGAIAGNGTCFLPDNVRLGTTVEDQKRAEQNIPALLRTIGEIGARSIFLSVEPLLGPVDLTKVHHTAGYGCSPCSACGSPVYIDALTGESYCKEACDGPRFDAIDWVIVGGESGRLARPMHPDWVRSLRDQCAAAGVPFLFKQWGEHLPMGQHLPGHGRIHGCTAVRPGWHKLHYDGSADRPSKIAFEKGVELHMFHDCASSFRVGKKAAGRLLDGVEHNGFPEVSR